MLRRPDTRCIGGRLAGVAAAPIEGARISLSSLSRGVTVGCHCFKVGSRDRRGDGRDGRSR